MIDKEAVCSGARQRIFKDCGLTGESSWSDPVGPPVVRLKLAAVLDRPPYV